MHWQTTWTNLINIQTPDCLRVCCANPTKILFGHSEHCEGRSSPEGG